MWPGLAGFSRVAGLGRVCFAQASQCLLRGFGRVCPGVCSGLARVRPDGHHRAGSLRVSGGSVRVYAGRVCVQLLGLNLSQPARVIPGLRVWPGLGIYA